jgi:hypothetical protein
MIDANSPLHLSLPRKSRQWRVLAGSEKSYDNNHQTTENEASL